MFTRSIRTLCVAALVAGLTCSGLACVAEAGPPAAYGYEPQYYDGYVVYYDDGGRPFYYVNGTVVWVPTGSAYYGGLVAHWHAHGPAYGRWNAHHGYRYRGYRRR